MPVTDVPLPLRAVPVPAASLATPYMDMILRIQTCD